MDNDMKTIEERAWEKYPEVIKHHNLAHIDINEEKRKMYIDIATEQKAIDEAKLLKLKSAWEKEAQITHDDEANRNQGYHDAIEKACKWLEGYCCEIGCKYDCNFDDIMVDGPKRFRKAMEK